MRHDLYQAETSRIAHEQGSLLGMAQQRLQNGEAFSALEQSGILHVLQVLIENAIGKSKHWLRAAGRPVPVSAHDAFDDLVKAGILAPESIAAWHSAIGIRNRIVHDYMNIDMQVILPIVESGQYKFITEFLLRPITVTGST